MYTAVLSTLDEKIFDEINAKIDATKIQVNDKLDRTLVVSANIFLIMIVTFSVPRMFLCSCGTAETGRSNFIESSTFLQFR